MLKALAVFGLGFITVVTFALFESAQRRRRGERLVGIGNLAGRRLHGRIVAERLVVVEVFVAGRQAEDPLLEHAALLMHDVDRIARVRQTIADAR